MVSKSLDWMDMPLPPSAPRMIDLRVMVNGPRVSILLASLSLMALLIE